VIQQPEAEGQVEEPEVAHPLLGFDVDVLKPNLRYPSPRLGHELGTSLGTGDGEPCLCELLGEPAGTTPHVEAGSQAAGQRAPELGDNLGGHGPPGPVDLEVVRFIERQL